uniref:Cytosol aminopeptidase n=1 Tax=Schistocephalus solidus TaxID=70667 RepID=A0A0X3PA01_SCHSO
MSRAEEYIPTPIAQCLTQPPELNKKQMPRIINYLSDEDDDDDDDDDEDSKPLAELRLDFAQFPALDYSSQQLSSVDACSPPNSDDEDPALADYLQYPSLLSATIPHAFSSKDFQRLVKKQSPTYSEKLRIPNSYVVFFHEILSSGELPTQGLSFGNLSKMITDRWNQLPSRERLKYREKASNTKQSYSRHLAAYRAKLLALSSRERPICRHSPCSKPVTSDRRWNLQYCSADCLLAHCQVTFARRYRCLQEENQIKVLQPASVTSRVSTNEVQAFATVSHFALRDCSVELRQSDYQSVIDQSASEISPAYSASEGDAHAAINPHVTDSVAAVPVSALQTVSIPSDNLFERFRWNAHPPLTQLNTANFLDKTSIIDFPMFRPNKES